MKTPTVVTCLLGLGVMACVGVGDDGTGESVVALDVKIVVSDGTTLDGEVLIPGAAILSDGSAADGQEFPALLSMTPYGPALYHSDYIDHGYVHVNVDVRGTGGSQGVQCLFCDREAQDVHDVVEWIAAQPWSDGNVGMLGNSYQGILPLLGAAKQPPHLKAIASTHAYSDLYRDLAWHNGIYALTIQAVYLALADSSGQTGASDTTNLERLENEQLVLETRPRPWADDPWYLDRAVYNKYDQIKVPVLHMAGWFDVFTRGSLDNFNGVASKHNRLIVDPCTHHGCGAPADPLSEYADTAAPPGPDPVLAWFDHFLKGQKNGIEREPPVMYYDLGTKEWLSDKSWPPRWSHTESLFLSGAPSGSSLSLNDGSLVESSAINPDGADQYIYDPTTGGGDAASRWGAAVLLPHVRLDQRVEEVHSLTYTTAVMGEPLSLAGPIELHFWGSTTASDTDWIVKIVDVAPNGESKLLTAGYVRASHKAWEEELSRLGRPFLPNTSPSAVPASKALEYRIDIIDVAHTVKKGHRLRIVINSADVVWHEPLAEPALNMIFRGSSYPSRLVVTVRGKPRIPKRSPHPRKQR